MISAQVQLSEIQRNMFNKIANKFKRETILHFELMETKMCNITCFDILTN